MSFTGEKEMQIKAETELFVCATKNMIYVTLDKKSSFQRIKSNRYAYTNTQRCLQYQKIFQVD